MKKLMKIEYFISEYPVLKFILLMSCFNIAIIANSLITKAALIFSG
jgi:hypothetical protein